jgi:putative cell wall-binding protein
VAGSDRYATSLAVAKRLGGVLGPLGKAVVVSGHNFPDALSAAPLAAYRGWPIVLASGSAVPRSTRDTLADLEVTSTLVVGDEDAVSAGYAAGLPEPARLAGENRYETGAAVVAYSLANGLLPDRIAVASGTRFPDALAGSVLAARARAPMLLATASSLPPATSEALASAAPHTVRLYVLGGTSAIGQSTLEQAELVVRTQRPLAR